jgi:hypothetical protein
MCGAIKCSICLCYENEDGECCCTSFKDKEELTPNSDLCTLFYEKYRDEELFYFTTEERLLNFFDNYEGFVKTLIFDETSTTVLYKKFKIGNETERFFIQITEEDLNKFEFRVSSDREIFSVDKNQEDFSEQLLS